MLGFAVGITDEFKVVVELHQGSVLSPFLFAVVMERLKGEISVQTSPLHFVVSILSFIFVICDVVGLYMVGYLIDCSAYDIIFLCCTWYMVKALNVLPLCIYSFLMLCPSVIGTFPQVNMNSTECV